MTWIKNHGISLGPCDGLYGSRTESAIKDASKASGRKAGVDLKELVGDRLRQNLVKSRKHYLGKK